MMYTTIVYLATAVVVTSPSMCSALIYRVPITPEWIEFWKIERKPHRINMLSSCPWRYRLNATKSDCGNYFAELHPLVRNNCLDVDQSSLSRRVHSVGRCIALRAPCNCDKVIGYTCVYPVDIPAGNAGKRNSDDKQKCNTTMAAGDKNGTTENKDRESANETTCKEENKIDEISSTISTVKPFTTEKQQRKTTTPAVMAPPFLKPDHQQDSIPPFLRRNNFQMGPPSFLQGLNPQLGMPPLLRPSQFNLHSPFRVNDRKTDLDMKDKNTKEGQANEESD